ncbi:MAG: DUF4340 domain-containing protein [Clostridia bacterium]|nr:DUF4340 domain-containing protein [Clostridia bacterium]
MSRDTDSGDDATSLEEGILIVDFTASDIHRLEYTYGEQKVTLDKKEGEWFIEGFDGYKADWELAEKMASSLAQTTAMRHIEEGVPADYGLDEPSLSVRVTLKDGSEHKLDVGIMGSYKGYSYLSYDGKIYMFSDSLSQYFNVSVKELLGLDDNFPASISEGTVMSLSVTDEIGNTLTYTDCAEMTEFISKLKLAFRFQDIVAANAKDDMTSYGIGESARRIDIFYNAPSDTVPNLLIDANYSLLIGGGDDGEVYYVIDGSSNVYVADADSVNSLFESILSHESAHRTECEKDSTN